MYGIGGGLSTRWNVCRGLKMEDRGSRSSILHSRSSTLADMVQLSYGMRKISTE
jgi:hypothetical protein